VPGVTPKISQASFGLAPARVNMRAHALGDSLAPMLNAIVDWSHGSLAKVYAARAVYEKKLKPKKARVSF